jgi:pimeloyl-ACP methyl ester carboxylesterase
MIMNVAGKMAGFWLAGISLTLGLNGCTASSGRATQLAQQHGLAVGVVEGAPFRHQIFFRPGSPSDSLWVFIEGDGSPWTADGMQPSSNPTPRRALALELAVNTPHAVLYLGRPCYFVVHADADCVASVWTSDRYSPQVLESMSAVVNRFATEHGFNSTVLLGYSGGGTLAVLMAKHVPTVSAVITIAADLDVTAWSRWHGYLPLTGSLNPATQPPLAASIWQLHLVGDRDLNVPPTLSERYFENLRPGQVWRYAQFDHVCCWVESWPNILDSLDAAKPPGHP